MIEGIFQVFTDFFKCVGLAISGLLPIFEGVSDLKEALIAGVLGVSVWTLTAYGLIKLSLKIHKRLMA